MPAYCFKAYSPISSFFLKQIPEASNYRCHSESGVDFLKYAVDLFRANIFSVKCVLQIKEDILNCLSFFIEIKQAFSIIPFTIQ